MDRTAEEPEFERAFPALFMAAYHVTHRLLGNVAQAEDAAAEAVARALVGWRKVGVLDHREAWVVRVASNIAIDEIRRRGRRGSTRLAANPPASDTTEEAALRLALAAALSALSPRQREVIALRYLVDLDEAQVARVLGISINSVKKHAVRGRAALRERLGTNPEVSLVMD